MCAFCPLLLPSSARQALRSAAWMRLRAVFLDGRRGSCGDIAKLGVYLAVNIL